MKTVTVVQPFVSVNSGVVGLTAEQAKTRLHNLKAVKAGKDGAGEYEVVKPIQFKLGESFEYSGEIAKDGAMQEPAAAEHARHEKLKHDDSFESSREKEPAAAEHVRHEKPGKHR